MSSAKLDEAVIAILQLDSEKTSVSSHGAGGCSSAKTSKITTTLPDGSMKHYFMKTGKGRAAQIMFEGEHASLSAIHSIAAVARVVPGLLADDHLNSGKGIVPVVVHGDLWSGNASTGLLPGMSEPEDIVFDCSACYAHSEFELGMMQMSGGFGRDLLREHHDIIPHTEPVAEYDDRIKFYELYHHLNHHAMFGGGYRSGAISIIKKLLGKYG